MSKPNLDTLTRALRAEVQGDDPVREVETFDRIVADLNRKKVSFLSMRRVPLVLLAAAFVFATALAGATGRLRSVFAAVERLMGAGTKAAPQEPLRPAPASSVLPPVDTPPQVAEAPSSLLLPTAIGSVAAAPSVRLSHSKSVLPTASAPTDVPTEASSVAVPAAPIDAVALDESLYREAHRLHFVDHNWSGALTAWDAYLAKVKGGKFALEARYNRALCLVRLGRTADAKRALAPFARGEYGAYRQSEAQGLLDRLEQAPPKGGVVP